MDTRALYKSIGSPDAFWNAVDCLGRYFMGDAPVHRALKKLAAILEEQQIPYAIGGAMALTQHGYIRAAVDVDLLLTADGLAKLKSSVLGLGYVEKFPGSKGLRDTENNVLINVLIAGDYPGDGKPKPVRFPDPALVSISAGGARFLQLGMLIELKLASGISAPHPMKDLTDVLGLVRIAKLAARSGE